MIIDSYCHVFPERFFEEVFSKRGSLENLGKRMQSIASLVNLDKRFAEMDKFGDYRQIISLPNPSLEEIADAADGARLAVMGNDGLAELCSRFPDRFPAFVAQVSLKDVSSALDEIDRAIGQLGAKGIQIFSNVDGRPLDDVEYAPVFEKLADFDLPIWLHPARTAAMTDYASEAHSRYEMWWCFGWPYETSVAMSRLVFSGVFDRHPELKIITHHLGGMIPYFDGRVGPGMEVLGSRTTSEDYSNVLPSLQRPHIDYFKQFYADTALFGSSTGLPTGIDFFGTDNVVFASDTPFGPIGRSIDAIESLGLNEADLNKIRYQNIQRLLKLNFE